VAASAPKAPVLGGKAKVVSLEASVFASEVKPHLVHETVRAELNAARAGTRGAKSRGLVAGGRSKPWRQKGTGRARAGTTRAPHWTGGGVAFPPGMRSYEGKVNRKIRRAALRGALSAHAANGTLALVVADAFAEPSTKDAAALLSEWGSTAPTLVVASEDEESLIKSFRNLDRVLVTVPAELEVASVVWARSLLVSEAALPLVLARAGATAGAIAGAAETGAAEEAEE
jgi:large subunit ribosomal protein L4